MSIICPACLTENSDSSVVCQVCGFSPLSDQPDLNQNDPLLLPVGYLLKQGLYRVEKSLGRGGFGVTYLATDLSNSQQVAIKELFPDGGVMRQGTSVYWSMPKEQQEYIQKFALEYQYLSQCIHFNIVKVIEFFSENKTAYIVMNFIPGKSLSSILNEEGKLPVDRVKRYFIQIAEALKIVHANSFLHRDINPNNILIDRQDNPILIDFGNVREFIAGKSKDMTRIITPGYAPPEQYITRAKRSPSTDLYALCASMYHLITGEYPPDSIERQQSDTLIPPSQLVSNLDPVIEQVILTGLRIRAEERFQSAAELIDALQGQFVSPSLRRARQLASDRKLPEAIIAYRACLNSEPQNLDAGGELAMVLMYVDESQAETVARQAIQKKANDGRGHGVIGLINCRRANWSEALKHLQSAANFSPAEAWIQANLAWALGKCGKWQQAEIAANRAVELDDRCLFAKGLQAWIAVNQLQWKGAIRYGRSAIFQSKQSSNEQQLHNWVYPCLVIALDKAMVTQQATDLERCLQEFLTQVSDSAFAWGFKGWKQAKQGLWSEALACFEQATRQSQIPSWVLCDRAITEEHLQNLHEAIQTYQICVQKPTLNAFAAFRLGTLLAKTQQWQEARSHLEKAIHLKPDYAEAYHNLGWVLLNERNAEGEIDNTRELLSAYRRAVELYTQQYRQDLVQTIKQAFQIAGVELG
jgi:eukaryotic-like serine/threonine-protein kinase